MINRFKLPKGFHFKIFVIISGTLLIFFFGKSLTAQQSDIEAFSEETYSLSLVRYAPVYPGCEKLDGEFYIRKCLLDKIDEHFRLNFNSTLLKNLEVPRVYVMMVINKDGRISSTRRMVPSDPTLDDEIASTKLDDEIARVVNLLPKLKPGIRNDNPVNVKYSVMINLDNNELKIRSR